MEKFGYATAENARKTASDLRRNYVSYLRHQATYLNETSDSIEKGEWSLLKTPDADEPSHDNIRYAINAYEEASRHAEENPSSTCKIEIQHVWTAKKMISHHYEETVVPGMRVEWIEGIEGGEWERRYREGEVLGIASDKVAIIHITDWHRGCGSSMRDIVVMPLTAVRANRPD
jgi:hypothetical protein